MEHISRGRRSGNEGVIARLRGRFRIFSARHCSRTKVSHAENSGMTMIFLTSSVSPTPPPADWGGRIRCAGRPREWSCGAVPPQERWHEEVLVWGILLRLDWEPLREGRLKVARGRSWQPEIGMEHASRGRRSGNKGVGARWRGRFRIFSARHCSRTKVSHAENSGMTMLFFSWRLLRCRRDVDHGSGHAAPCHLRSGWHERVRGGGFNPLRGATTGVVMRRRATTGVDGTRVKALWVCFTLRAAARE